MGASCIIRLATPGNGVQTRMPSASYPTPALRAGFDPLIPRGAKAAQGADSVRNPLIVGPSGA
jgi:hypothetical protein